MSVQLATIFEAKYGEVSKQVEQVKAQLRGSRNEPIVPQDFFDRWVRQSMLVNLDQFIEPAADLPFPVEDEWECGAMSSKTTLIDFYQADSARVREVLDSAIDDAAAMLEDLPDRNADSTLEASGIINIINLAHGKQIDGWTEELKTTIKRMQSRKRKSISLLDLICALESRHHASRQDCFIKTWLAFLLGKHSYQLRRTAHDFYSTVGIEVIYEYDQNE